MMNKSEVIKNLLSNKTNVRRVKDLILSRGEMQAVSCWCPRNEDELEKYLITLPNEEFISMMNELGIDVHMASVSSTATSLPVQDHQNLQDPRGDDLLAFTNEQPTDCNNIDLLPKPQSPVGSGSESPKADVSELELKSKDEIIKQLKIKLKDLETENEKLRMELQKSQKKQHADSKYFIECKAKGQVLKNNNNLMMSQQVSAMGKQLEELNQKKAQIENALKQFQEESSEDKENHLQIILYFREVMGERTKKIKELEAEVQVLKNTNPENDYPVQLYEKAKKLEHELSQLYLKTKTNSELLMRVKENCQELRNENEKLKEDLRKKEDEIQMQQASQAASCLSREVELAGRVYEEVNRLQRVYVELMEFARRQGFQWTGALNDESDDE